MLTVATCLHSTCAIFSSRSCLCCLHLPLLQSICINWELHYKVCSVLHFVRLYSLLFGSIPKLKHELSLSLFLSQLMGQQTRCTSVPSPSSFAFAPGPSLTLSLGGSYSPLFFFGQSFPSSIPLIAISSQLMTLTVLCCAGWGKLSALCPRSRGEQSVGDTQHTQNILVVLLLLMFNECAGASYCNDGGSSSINRTLHQRERRGGLKPTLQSSAEFCCLCSSSFGWL